MITSKKYHQHHVHLQKISSATWSPTKVTLFQNRIPILVRRYKSHHIIASFPLERYVCIYLHLPIRHFILSIYIDWVFHTEYIYWSYHTEFLLYWLYYTRYFILTTGLLAILVSQTLTFPSRPPLTYCRIALSSSWCWKYENSSTPTPTPTPTPIPAYQLRRTNTPPPSPINTVHHLNSFNNS